MKRERIKETARKLRGQIPPLPEKSSKFLQEFREFAMRGNIVDLAVGIMIGTAFNKIVTSIVNDIVMPPFAYLTGKVSFNNFFINLGETEYATIEDAKTAGAPTINYGLFINNILEFIIIAFVTFLVVRQLNRMRRRGDVPPTTKECPFCVTVIPIRAIRCPACTSEVA